MRKFCELTWFELDALDRERTLVFLPISPLEQHGPHLPLGMDMFGAEYVTRRMGDLFGSLHPEWEVLLVPVLPVGSNAFDFPGSLFTRQRLVRDLLVDFGASLARHGFKNLVLVSVHGGTGHIVAMEEAAEIVSRRFKCRVLAPLGAVASKFFSGAYFGDLDRLLPRPLTDEEKELLQVDWHAGWWETSLMLLARPDLVKPDYDSLEEVVVDDFRKINDQLCRTVGGGAGYLGAPSRATREFGEVLTGLFVRDAVRLIERSVVQREEVGADGRSPLFDIPFMRTDFVRNSVAVGAGVLLTLLGGIPLVDAVRNGKIQIPGMEKKDEEEADLADSEAEATESSET
ncbi:MAG: creatininase family protein [Candidatus Eremiobacterota bacterium]